MIASFYNLLIKRADQVTMIPKFTRTISIESLLCRSFQQTSACQNSYLPKPFPSSPNSGREGCLSCNSVIYCNLLLFGIYLQSLFIVYFWEKKGKRSNSFSFLGWDKLFVGKNILNHILGERLNLTCASVVTLNFRNGTVNLIRRR